MKNKHYINAEDKFVTLDTEQNIRGGESKEYDEIGKLFNIVDTQGAYNLVYNNNTSNLEVRINRMVKDKITSIIGLLHRTSYLYTYNPDKDMATRIIIQDDTPRIWLNEKKDENGYTKDIYTIIHSGNIDKFINPSVLNTAAINKINEENERKTLY